MKSNNPENYTEERPWGSFTVLDSGKGYKVKRISVKPSQRLSLQYHHHRKEYWTVVKGDETILVHHKDTQDYFKDTLKSGKSVFIPKGAKHRLSNHTEEMVEIIEVQCGDYLEEDDIVRLDDDYERDIQKKG